MKRLLALMLILCLFLTAARLFRLQVQQKIADFNAAEDMRHTAELLMVQSKNGGN